MQPDGDLLDYRARAATCRAKAEKAGEHPGEANTWLQVAAMWDGLADRLERGVAPVPPASAAPEPDAAPIAEAPPKTGPELPPREVPRTLPPAAVEPARPRSPLRRAAVVAALLLVSLAAVLWLWPRTDRPKETADRSGGAEETAVPRPPSAAPANGEPATKTVAAQPAQKAPVQTADAAPPAQVAVAPPEARPEPPKAEPDTKAAGQGSDLAAPDAAPSPAEAGPALPASADATPAALPPSEPPAAAAQFGPAAGTWWPEACPTAAERRTAVPMILAEDRARAGASSCTFQKKTPAPNGWTIVARCSDGRESWTAHIRLVHAGKRLQWASERGSLTYFRCS